MIPTKSWPEAEYQIFRGFNIEDWKTISGRNMTRLTSNTTNITASPKSLKTSVTSRHENQTQANSTKHPPHVHHHLSDHHHRKHHQSNAMDKQTTAISLRTPFDWQAQGVTQEDLEDDVENQTKVTQQQQPSQTLPPKELGTSSRSPSSELPPVIATLEDFENQTELAQQQLSQTLPPMEKLDCPEEEEPWNIGPYEVPTQRDLVLLSVATLHRVYRSYHQKAMLFLDDIQKVVRATDHVAKKCRGDKEMYRKCIRSVSNKCKEITKSLTTTLEQQRQDILLFGQNKICSIEDMKEDPVKLLKILASEEVSLEFALPGFLILLNVCKAHCMSPTSTSNFKLVKPTRHLTDADIVIRHFLTQKKYSRLLKPTSEKPKPYKKITIPNAKMRKPLKPNKI